MRGILSAIGKRFPRFEVIAPREGHGVRAALNAAQEYLGAGAAVAARVVMVEADAEAGAHRVQPVVRQLGIDPPAHAAGADIGGRAGPVHVVARNAFCEHAHIKRLAHEVIAGKWGNGQERIDRLKAAGYNPTMIQNKVNEILK